MAVPASNHYRRALDAGDTLPRRPHIHWVERSKERWVEAQRERGCQIIAVEVGGDAIPLTLLESARQPTVLLLGNEREGLPVEAIALADERVEIPMIGIGSSLNVAVAGSLVAYRLAGLS